MSDIINPATLRTGSQAISAVATELLASREAPRGGLVLNNSTDGVIYIAMASVADAATYPISAGEELALGDYRGALWIRGDGSGSVYYAYTE